MATGNLVRFDGSANSIFSRVTLTSNGGVLEDFNKCNVYIPIVYDLTTDPITRSSYYSFFGNFEAEQPVLITYSASAAAGAFAISAEGEIQIENPLAEADVLNAFVGVANSVTT